MCARLSSRLSFRENRNLAPRATIEEAAGIGLVVDALHERAAKYYRSFGFEAFKDDPHRLFLRVDWP
jgi:hypothetical protein